MVFFEWLCLRSLIPIPNSCMYFKTNSMAEMKNTANSQLCNRDFWQTNGSLSSSKFSRNSFRHWQVLQTWHCLRTPCLLGHLGGHWEQLGMSKQELLLMTLLQPSLRVAVRWLPTCTSISQYSTNRNLVCCMTWCFDFSLLRVWALALTLTVSDCMPSQMIITSQSGWVT